MRRIVWSIIVFMLVLSALWLATGWASFKEPTFFGLRDGIIQLSGVLGIGLMTVGVLLSARPKRLEGLYDGMDKMYLLHKWVGIVALVVCIFHWFMASGFKFLIQWGLMAGGGGRPGGFGERGGSAGEASQTLIQKLTGPAHWTSEWAFYLMLILGAIALFTFIAYWLFALSHRLLNIVYIVIAFHSARTLHPRLLAFAHRCRLGDHDGCRHGLLDPGAVPYPDPPAARPRPHRGPAGFPRARRPARGHRPRAGMEGPRGRSVRLPQDRALRGSASLHHRFGLAGDGKLSFVIKNLGDYTGKLKERLKVGGKVKLEGPYGRFDFEDGGKKRQIWVGAGVGITPFIAALQRLQREPSSRKVVLYHPTSQASEEAFGRLCADAQKAGVELRIWNSKKQGRLTAKRIMEENPDWKDASVWFCGPAGFLKAAKRDFLEAGLREADFPPRILRDAIEAYALAIQARLLLILSSPH